MSRGTGDRQKLFNYATEREAPEHRAIMDFFLEAAAEYRAQLTIQEVDLALRSKTPPMELDRKIIERRLDSLYEWGNLHRDRDESRAVDLAAYERRSFVYSLSAGGEAAHEALIGFEDRLQRAVGLQTAALRQVLATLTDLASAVSSDFPDGELVFHRVEELHRNFKALTGNAAVFVQKVTRMLGSPSLEPVELHLFKADTINYLTGFMDDLMTLADDIRARIVQLGELGEGRLVIALQAGAGASGERSLDGSERTTWAQAARKHLDGVAEWFLPSGNAMTTTGADRLHSIVRHAVLGIGRAVEQIREASQAPSSRAVDLLALARWFHTAPDEASAREIWHIAFGLGSARHFVHECPNDDVPPSLSWWQAPAEPYLLRLRAISSGDRPRRATQVPDHSASKRLLAERANRTQAVLRTASSCLVKLGRFRLSTLAIRLDRATLELLAALLSRAQRARMDQQGRRRARSVDGRLQITLGEPRSGAAARVESELGSLTLRDYEVEVLWARGPAAPEPVDAIPPVCSDGFGVEAR